MLTLDPFDDGKGPDPTHWRDEAACVGHEDVFWGGDHGPANTGKARGICARCPVTGDCLAEALARTDPDDWGVWGGTTRHERVELRRERRNHRKDTR